MTSTAPVLLLSRQDVQSLLDMPSCISAVEEAFRLHGAGASLGPGVLGAHGKGGGFHVKAAGLEGSRAYYAAKVNANFPDNPTLRGLPTIQGIIALFDATNGVPLAIMDSIEITSLRTAAASAVAAKFLALESARTLAIIGCGIQGRIHLRAMTNLRRFDRIIGYDADHTRAAEFSRELSPEIGIAIETAGDVRAAIGDADVIVTCTPARGPFVFRGDVKPGAFLAAVGADNEHKQELDPALLAESVVVVDVLDQCATIGELHHALEAGLMTRDDVRADLTAVVSNKHRGRLSDDEVVIFDSTGTALQDVAAAALTYERACAAGIGFGLRLAD